MDEMPDISIILQLGVLLVAGFNAWLTVKTKLEMTEMKIYVLENFVHKKDLREDD